MTEPRLDVRRSTSSRLTYTFPKSGAPRLSEADADNTDLAGEWPGHNGAVSDPSPRRRLARHLWLVILAPVVVGIVVAVTVAILTGAWSPLGHDESLARTEVRLYAVSLFGQPRALDIAGKDTGSCSRSNVNPVPNAYHCVGNRFVYDPCFGDYGVDLVCVGSPWVESGIRFDVRRFRFFIPETGRTVEWNPRGSAPFPDVARSGDGDVTKAEPPWAVELANGQRCVLVSGATFVVAGQRGNYQCSKKTGFNAGRGSWLLGEPDRVGPLWRASYLPDGAFETHQVEVEVAWY